MLTCLYHASNNKESKENVIRYIEGMIDVYNDRKDSMESTIHYYEKLRNELLEKEVQ
jgi:hypothetical protein